MRISEVIGMRIRAKREESGWSQAYLGTLIGYETEKEWSRQAVSAAEKGKRQFTAAELVALASVLNVSLTYLLMPPPGAGRIEYEAGVFAGVDSLSRALDIYRGTSAQEVAYAEAGEVLFRHLEELRRVAEQVQADLDHLTRAAGMPPTLRDERDAARRADVQDLFDAADRIRDRADDHMRPEAGPEEP